MRFRFLGDAALTFPHVSLNVEPGDTVDVDENPDPRWFAEEGAPAQPEATPQEEDE